MTGNQRQKSARNDRRCSHKLICTSAVFLLALSLGPMVVAVAMVNRGSVNKEECKYEEDIKWQSVLDVRHPDWPVGLFRRKMEGTYQVGGQQLFLQLVRNVVGSEFAHLGSFLGVFTNPFAVLTALLAGWLHTRVVFCVCKVLIITRNVCVNCLSVRCRSPCSGLLFIFFPFSNEKQLPLPWSCDLQPASSRFQGPYQMCVR